MEILTQSAVFGIALTVFAYWAGMTLQKKTRLVICNGMLLTVVMLIVFLQLFHIFLAKYHLNIYSVT